MDFDRNHGNIVLYTDKNYKIIWYCFNDQFLKVKLNSFEKPTWYESFEEAISSIEIKNQQLSLF